MDKSCLCFRNQEGPSRESREHELEVDTTARNQDGAGGGSGVQDGEHMYTRGGSKSV